MVLIVVTFVEIIKHDIILWYYTDDNPIEKLIVCKQAIIV